MKLAGFARSSFVDYPGNIAAVAFFAGCNYDCFFCHNRGIIGADAPLVSEETMWDYLEKRRGLLDGVVATGGEPTLQPELADFLRRVRRMGYRTKLDTNGSNPAVVLRLLDESLLDYVALDVKAPAERYAEYCGGAADYAAVMETLELLRGSGVHFECRTTFLPQLCVEDIARIARDITPVPRYAIQAYRTPQLYKPTDRFRVLVAGHSLEDTRRAAEVAKVCGGEVIIRG